MDYYNYLKNTQPVVFRIFERALAENKLFHAYLFVGDIGTPLVDIATYIGASIIDKGERVFADDDSNILHRMLNNSFADLYILDTQKESVKIDQIRTLEDQFSKTASEIYNTKIYIINLIENLSTITTNALLKFLEEPQDNTYAFLITHNENMLLPTIKSRVQTLHFFYLNQEQLISESMELGVNEEDAELLSFFANDAELIEKTADSAAYKNVKDLVLSTLKNSNNYLKLLTFTLNNTVKKIKQKQDARDFFDYLSVFFKESLKLKHESKIILTKYDNILNGLKDMPDLEDAIFSIMNARNEINYNVNLSLLIVHTIQKIFKNI